MAQFEEITIDQGADATIQLELVNQDGSAKNLVNHSVTAKLKKIIVIVVERLRLLPLQLLMLLPEQRVCH